MISSSEKGVVLCNNGPSQKKILRTKKQSHILKSILLINPTLQRDKWSKAMQQYYRCYKYTQRNKLHCQSDPWWLMDTHWNWNKETVLKKIAVYSYTHYKGQSTEFSIKVISLWIQWKLTSWPSQLPMLWDAVW